MRCSALITKCECVNITGILCYIILYGYILYLVMLASACTIQVMGYGSVYCVWSRIGIKIVNNQRCLYIEKKKIREQINVFYPIYKFYIIIVPIMSCSFSRNIYLKLHQYYFYFFLCNFWKLFDRCNITYNFIMDTSGILDVTLCLFIRDGEVLSQSTSTFDHVNELCSAHSTVSKSDFCKPCTN